MISSKNKNKFCLQLKKKITYKCMIEYFIITTCTIDIWNNNYLLFNRPICLTTLKHILL